MITVSESAQQHLKQLAEEQGIDKLILRFKTIGGGCGGLQYDLYFDEVIQESDEVFINNDIIIIVDNLSFLYLDGCHIDLVENNLSSSFKINNPNATTCGCGNSFSV